MDNISLDIQKCGRSVLIGKIVLIIITRLLANMKKNKILISVVVPVLNEELSIKEFYQQLVNNIETYEYEIIFVNDGSKDKSQQIINDLRQKDKKVKLINLTRNFGHQIAITCGIDHSNGDAVIIIDADLQDPTSMIPKMIRKWQKGFDVVYGIRKERLGENLIKIITAKIFYKLVYLLSGKKIPENVGDFRLISKQVVQTLKTTREYQRFLRGIISWMGYKHTGLFYRRQQRYAGETKYSTYSMIKLALDALLSFSFFPLRIASILGAITAFGAVGMIFYALYVQSIGQTVKGWSSTMVIILFLGSVQLITIGIIGEYLGRIYEEVKRRPLYIISSKIGI